MPPARIGHFLAVAALCAAAPAFAATDRWACTIAPTSTYSQTTQIQLPLAGTWIGNYEAVTNPTGTQTRPGLFGGSGNVAIPFTSVVRPRAVIANTNPTGSYVFGLDRATGAVEVTGLALNALGAQGGTIETRMTLTYSTFRTFAPNSTFIGVSNLDVPLDSGALTMANAVQSGPAIGAATANADGSWSFAVTVPVNVTVEGTALGAPFTSTSPGSVVMAGTATFNGDQAMLTSQGTVNETVPVPAPAPLVNMPFALPTILPPGATANLLMSGTFSEGTSSTTGSSSIVALGTLQPVFGDLNGDRAVNGFDLGLLLAAWGTNGQPGGADLNGDGTVNGFDLGLMLSAWG